MKNDPIHELTQTTDRHQRRIVSLEGKAGNLDNVRDRLRKLETKVGEHSVAAVLKKVEEIGTKLSATTSRLDGQAAKIVRLRRDLDTLHRTVRLNDERPRADFDTWPEISSDVVQLIRAGLASEQVSEAEVERLRKKREQAREDRLAWDKALEAAIAAVNALIGLPAGAERLWRRETRTWLAFRRLGKRPVEQEEHARRRHDEALRARQAATVAEVNSAAADETARAVIRARVVDALAQDLVPPPWFDSALGRFPPREPNQINPWVDVATRFLRYRLLASVDDPVHPFGDRPPDSALAAERDEVERLCEGQRW